ncbi:MAG: hypothetical protein NTX63_03415, partial [Candidatus Peregrinibacteria bacterium]|nr:hypothetical protein [Candidatus Peregrinibacteria bacterium]
IPYPTSLAYDPWNKNKEIKKQPTRNNPWNFSRENLRSVGLIPWPVLYQYYSKNKPKTHESTIEQ